MRSEPPDTAWGLLSERLRVFAEDAGAPNAIVFDSSGTILCRGHRPDEPQHVRIGSLVVDANEQLERTHARRVHLVDPEAIVLVFATIYRLGVWFDAPCDDIKVEWAAHAHLPTIEGLTTSLPPPEGPKTGSGRAAIRGR